MLESLADKIDLIPGQFWAGLVIGCIYGLLAIGYSMVYGVLNMMNFAHGDTYMIAAFGGWGMMAYGLEGGILAREPLLLLLPLMFAVAACTGALIATSVERIAFRPIYTRNASRLAGVIAALGAALALRQMVVLGQTWWGGSVRPRYIETPKFFPLEWSVEILDVRITAVAVLVVIVSLSVMFVTERVVQTTRIGRAMRATSQDSETASAMGVPVPRVIASTFFIGGILAGVAAVLVSLQFTIIDQEIGFPAMIKAFTAAVLGGIGSIRGAMVGGLVLGFTESLAVTFVDSAYRDVIAFSVLILVLWVRPTGLLGGRVFGYERV